MANSLSEKMSGMKKYILWAIAVVITVWLVYPDTTPNTPPPGMVLVETCDLGHKINFIQADGIVSKANIKEIFRYDSFGKYFEGYIYSFNFCFRPRHDLRRMKICGESKSEQVQGMEAFPYNKHNWPRVLYVDKDVIYFSAHVIDKFRHQFKRGLVIYKLDRKRHVVTLIDLNYIGFGISVAQGRIYYTNLELNIIFYHNGVATKTGLRGVEVSVSPDGKYLAYMGSNFITYNKVIKLHDLESGETKRVTWNMMTTFEKKIDWSPDSKYFSFKNASDISRTPLMIAEASTGEVVAKIEDRGRPFMITEDEYKKIMQECNYSSVQESRIED